MFRPDFNQEALKGMALAELEMALTDVQDNIKNLNRGVVPPHLKKRNLEQYQAEKKAIAAEIEQRTSSVLFSAP